MIILILKGAVGLNRPSRRWVQRKLVRPKEPAWLTLVHGSYAVPNKVGLLAPTLPVTQTGGVNKVGRPLAPRIQRRASSDLKGVVLKYIVAKIGSVSAKKGMTEIIFLPAENAELIWRSAWLRTDWVNEQVAPGIEITAEHIGLGKIERSYEKDGETIALKTPKQAVFFRGAISTIAPEMEALAEPVYTTNEQASAYAQAWRAKQAAQDQAPATDGDPF